MNPFPSNDRPSITTPYMKPTKSLTSQALKVHASLNKSTRGELFTSIDSPGPGQYDINFKPHGPKFSFSGKVQTKSIDTPGPGSYNPERVSAKTPKNDFIGKSTRHELQINDSPGPGTYDGRLSKASPSWSLHGTNPKPAQESLLGPGRYEMPSPKPTSMCITPRSRRPELFNPTDTPGPGQYSQDPKSPKFKSTFGTSLRPHTHDDNPGPGQYDQTLHTKTVSFKFSKELKKTLTVNSDTPGAGLYNPKINAKAPAFSFGKKLEAGKDNGIPGPGSYGAEKVQKVCTAKIGKSQRFALTHLEKEAMEKPGPGMYEMAKAKSSQKSDMGKAKRGFYKANDTPGPGQYNPIKV